MKNESETRVKVAAFTLKQKLGVVLKDWLRFHWNLRGMRLPGRRPGHWTRIRNRSETISTSPDGGVVCKWKWSSDLHCCKVFPSLGERLARTALAEWPIVIRDEALSSSARPSLSFIIGHRGPERLPLLLATLRSIAGQRDAAIECIVVEQSIRPEIAGSLPGWVRYVHTPLPSAEMPYCRSWAFNVGARVARGDVLVLHDNDILVPEAYGSEIVRRLDGGFEVANLKRFVFYLSKDCSERFIDTGYLLTTIGMDSITQNLEGGSVAVLKDVFFELGGFDESFVGWGGEDNEFWERARTRLTWPYGYLPMFHIWHESQAQKHDRRRGTTELLAVRSSVPAERRIEELIERGFGEPGGPRPVASADWHYNAAETPEERTALV